MPDRTDPEFLAGLIGEVSGKGLRMGGPPGSACLVAQLIACLPPMPELPDPLDWATRSLNAKTVAEARALGRELPNQP